MPINNITLDTEFNTSPYWDDFSELKRFHRILFKPSVAVQSRELLQLQTILQNQIDRFASHIFEEGSKVKGGDVNYDAQIYYIKLNDLNSLGNTVSVSNFDGMEITGLTSGVKAIVVDTADGSQVAANTKTLFVKVTDGGSNNTTLQFIGGENISSNNSFTATIMSSGTPVGLGSIITVDEGILYAKDHFIYFERQTLVLDRYSNQPSYHVGFVVDEEIIDYIDDSTLLDPASGAPNANAPGADRLRLTATLTKVPLGETLPAGFHQIMEFKDGVLQEMATRPEYSDIRDEMARRTYDESGNYTVRGLGVRVREHLNNGENGGRLLSADGGNNQYLALGVDPGLAYVHGYDYETIVTTWLQTPKGVDYKDVEGVSIAANYGNYIIVDEMVGYWDIKNGSTVTLYYTAEDRISTRAGSSTSPAGLAIGTARVRAVTHHSGTPGLPTCQYRLYIYDVEMTGAPFAYVRSVYLNNASGTDACADIVLDGGNAVLYESQFKSAIFPIPASAIRRIRDASGNIDFVYQWYSKSDVTIATDGTFTLSTDVDETFPLSVGALNNTQKLANFLVMLDTTVDTTNLTGTIEISNSNTAVIGTGTAFTTQLHVGDFIKVGSDVRRITAITDATHLTLDANCSGSSSGNNFKKTYLAGHILDYTANGVTNVARSITINSSTSATFDLKETLGTTVNAKVITALNKVDQQEKKKVKKNSRYVRINCSTHSEHATGPWCLGFADVIALKSVRIDTSNFTSSSQGTDVTDSFILDNGQRDSHYDLARLINNGASISNSSYLLVEVDYFTHDTSLGDGYLSVDSYPIDDVNAANTSAIQTEEIPIYTSPTTGWAYDLRNCIDCRPRATDTATDTTVVTSSTTNPAWATALNATSDGLRTPVVNEDFTFDLSYYLPRKDIIILEQTGNFKVVRGISDRVPITPQTPDHAMALAVLEIPPYPSLTPPEALAIGRQDYAVKVRNIPNKRYTMRDIGVLDQRLSIQEYYNLLNTLEKQTSDMIIPDDNGLDRFKNGILVDPFQGSKVANVYDIDYAAAIDPQAKELRARASINHVAMQATAFSNTVRNAADATLILASATANTFTAGETIYQGASLGAASATGVLRHGVDSRLYVEEVDGTFAAGANAKGATSSASVMVDEVRVPRPGNLVTLPYTHEIFAQQRFATATRNAAGLYWRWKGHIDLTPSIDMWTSTTRNPDVTVNFDNNLDAWQQLADAWGTEWNSWSTRWTGTQVLASGPEISEGTRTQSVTNGNLVTTTTFEDYRVQQTSRTITEQFRSRNGLVVTPTTVTQNLGSNVVDVTLRPYMRPRRILVRATGLKPNTRVYAFFDGEAVSSYMTPISTNGWDYFTAAAAVPGQSGTSDGPLLLSELVNNALVVPYNETTTLTAGEVTLSSPSWYDPSWIGSIGDDLVTDADGDLLAFFDLPCTDAKHFPVGTRTLRLSDSSTNSSVQGQITTSAEAQYTAHGVNQTTQGTILSTQKVNIHKEVIEEVNVIDTITTAVNRGTRIIGQTTTTAACACDCDCACACACTPAVFSSDPIAQSFLARTNDRVIPGIFFSKIDLFFNTKHETLPFVFHIREMEATDVISNRVVPYSEVVVYPEDVHVSEDGSKPTVVVFPSLVYLQSSVSYAFVIKPMASNPDYRAFIAQLGDTDLATEERVIQQPTIGVLFAASNDRTWSPIQDEDIKYTLYRANFDISSSGTLTLGNQRREYLTLTDYTANFDIGEQVRGPLTLTANTLSGSANTGEYIWGSTSNAYGLIADANNSGKVFKISEEIPGRTFIHAEGLVFKFANGVATGASGNLHSLNVAAGYVDYFGVGAQNTALQLTNPSTFGFESGDGVRAQTSNAYGTIDGIMGVKMNLVQGQVSQLVFAQADIAWNLKGALSSSHAMQSTWTPFTINENYEFPSEMIVLSASEESGTRSLQFQATLSSIDTWLSPVVDLTSTNAIVVQNYINNDATGETNARGGNAVARYITRRVTLADNQDAEDAKAFVTLYEPPGTSVRVYIKFLHAEDSDLFDDRSWVEMTRSANVSYSDLQNKNDFREAEFNMPTSMKTGSNGEVQYVNSNGVTFTGYRYFAIKIVMLSNNTSVVPRCRDLRVIALQI